jgi:formate hydrogenlyase subunit 6/NADH:ubiquinone oxidoreductase subunit I
VDGAYIVDAAECVWCNICAQECPQEAVFSTPGDRTPVKCTSCGDCVEICPTGALAMVE